MQFGKRHGDGSLMTSFLPPELTNDTTTDGEHPPGFVAGTTSVDAGDIAGNPGRRIIQQKQRQNRPPNFPLLSSPV